MKRVLPAMLISLALAALLAGCGATPPTAAEDGERMIVTTIYPEYDWVMHILGENPAEITVTQLLDNGADLHSYQPTVSDMMMVSNCDLFVYLGGTSDAWVGDALRQSTNPNRDTLDMMEALGQHIREEELVEGMQGEEEGEMEDAVEYDEHIWLSLKNADLLCGVLTDKIAALDPDNAALYRQNADAYRAKLQALDAQYQAAVDAAPGKVLLFGDRFPFRYMVEDYGIDYYAAFVGCSAETEASFETVRFLADKIDTLGLTHVCVLESSDGKLANTIITASKAGPGNVSLVQMDSMQSVTTLDADEQGDYLTRMERNLTALQTALR